MEFKIEITSKPQDNDVDLLEKNLEQSITGCNTPRNYEPLCIFLRDSENKMIGALRGSTIWGWLQIKHLWIDEKLRGRDFGTMLIQRAEEESRKRGCIGSVVDTFDFQAVGFYKKVGYTQFGILDDFPLGHKRIYLKKKIG